jgi:hypothetical protein
MVEAERDGGIMKKQKKAISEFSSEQKEFEFWTTHNSSEYIDWKNAKQATVTSPQNCLIKNRKYLLTYLF